MDLFASILKALFNLTAFIFFRAELFLTFTAAATNVKGTEVKLAQIVTILFLFISFFDGEDVNGFCEFESKSATARNKNTAHSPESRNVQMAKNFLQFANTR
jgi:hypothetical protein